MRRLVFAAIFTLLASPLAAQQTRVASSCNSINMAWAVNDLGRPIMFDTQGRMCVNIGTDITQSVGGNVAAAATDSGNPVKIGGIYNTSFPSYTSGQRTNIQTDSGGKLFGVATGTSNITGGATSTSSTTAEAGRVLKASAGNLYSLGVTNLTATAGFVVVTNTTTVPADGAVTPIECIPIPASGRAELNLNPGPGLYFATGISVFITSAANCFTKTTGVVTGFFRGSVF